MNEGDGRNWRWIWMVGWLMLLLGCGEVSPLPTPPAASRTPPATPAIGVDFVTKAPPTVAVRRLTPSPPPSPTAIPSPTPIIYNVQEGETLGGIAWQRGYTVAEILALNPGVHPEVLQIGQALILPPPGTPRPGSVATAVPAAVAVQQIQAYRTPADRVWLLGVVRNMGEAAAENVQVTVTLPGAAEGEAETAVAWAAPPLLPPGADAPFAALLPAPAGGVGTPAVVVSGGTTVADLGNRYLDLAVAETAVAAGEGSSRVTGVVTNTGTAVAERILLVATVYDEEGRISGYRQQWLAAPLPPGERASFSLTLTAPGGAAARAAVSAQALIANTETTE